MVAHKCLKLIACLVTAFLVAANNISFAKTQVHECQLNTLYYPIKMATPSISAIRTPDGQGNYMLYNGSCTFIKVSEKVSDSDLASASTKPVNSASNYKWPTEVNDDFQAELGGNYVVKRWGVVCTLPAATGNYGKCVTVQNTAARYHNCIVFHHTFFRAIGDEHIFIRNELVQRKGPVWMELAEWNKKVLPHLTFRGRPNEITSGTFISNGEDWYHL